MLTLDTILKDSIWVAKMQGWREVGTYEQVGKFFHDEDCRDFDLCCEQPEHLKEFFNEYFKYNGFITIPEYYEKYYEPKHRASKVWTVNEIRELLKTNDKMLMRSLKKLYDCQTADEKASQEATHVNGAGFNKPDAAFMTSVAEFMLGRGYLTDKQKFAVRKRIMKYAGQLTRIANAC